MKVLIVDDSVVFRSQIRKALENHPNIQVVGTAANGKLALQKMESEMPDIVVLDWEMPVLNGLETLKEIVHRKMPARVLIFSSVTKRAADSGIEALRIGAVDIVEKPSSSQIDLNQVAETVGSALLHKILQFVEEDLTSAADGKMTSEAVSKPTGNLTEMFECPDAVVIGSSTGGPQALEVVLGNLKGPLKCPIYIAQHMPPLFTASLANRLQSVSGVVCKEAEQGELVGNKIYVAPGNYHMLPIRGRDGVQIKLTQEERVHSMRPAVDCLFAPAAELYGKKLLSLILTGMGEDGLIGARAIRRIGGKTIIQSKESCVVFGMPGALFREQEFDSIATPTELNRLLKNLIVDSNLSKKAG